MCVLTFSSFSPAVTILLPSSFSSLRCPRPNVSSFRRQLPYAQNSPPSSEPPSDQSDDGDSLSLLRLIESAPSIPEAEDTRVGEEVSRSKSLISYFFSYLREGLSEDVDLALARPEYLVLSAGLALLFGFFSATSASTIIGSVADWDPLASAVLLIWTESFTKFYYQRSRRSKLLQLINAFKIGLIYGMTVDAFKLTT